MKRIRHKGRERKHTERDRLSQTDALLDRQKDACADAVFVRQTVLSSEIIAIRIVID